MTSSPLAAWRRRSGEINSHLLTGLAFSLPFPPPVSNLMAGLLLLGWLAGGTVREDWRWLRSNPAVQAAAAFLLLHVVGLLWTEHLAEGAEVLAKEWKFLLLPVCMACAQPRHVERYLAAFVCAAAIAAALSYAIAFEALPTFNKATLANPVPFATHVVYGPLLAVAIYLVARRALFDRQLSTRWRVALALLAAVMAANLFLTIGRAGQVALCVAVLILCWQALGCSWRAFGLAVALIASVVGVAFASSDSFRARAIAAATGDAMHGARYDISIDERRAYLRNAGAVVADHPLLGVGTGDLAAEMRREHDARNDPARFRDNPHNMYLAMMGRFGVLGLAALAWLFIAQLRAARAAAPGSPARQVGTALPILFLVLCLAETYLALHATALLFCVFSGFLYRPPGPAEGAGR